LFKLIPNNGVPLQVVFLVWFMIIPALMGDD